MKNTINGMEIEVKAGLFVDEKTFNTCINLISIYAENNGIKGIIINFDEKFRNEAEVYKVSNDIDMYDIFSYADSLQNISVDDRKTFYEED